MIDTNTNIISIDDILEAYKNYEASKEAKDHVLYFISDLTGLSVDALLEKVYEKKSRKVFIVSWHAPDYTGTFCYRIAAENLKKAKENWESFVSENKRLRYYWKKAQESIKQHRGGYISWKRSS